MVRRGSRIRITSDNSNYRRYLDKEWVVEGVYVGESSHPGYDMGVYPQKLVECMGLPFALYEWEFEVV
jgi:hypothetical protein